MASSTKSFQRDVSQAHAVSPLAVSEAQLESILFELRRLGSEHGHAPYNSLPYEASGSVRGTSSQASLIDSSLGREEEVDVSAVEHSVNGSCRKMAGKRRSRLSRVESAPDIGRLHPHPPQDAIPHGKKAQNRSLGGDRRHPGDEQPLSMTKSEPDARRAPHSFSMPIRNADAGEDCGSELDLHDRPAHGPGTGEGSGAGTGVPGILKSSYSQEHRHTFMRRSQTAHFSLAPAEASSSPGQRSHRSVSSHFRAAETGGSHWFPGISSFSHASSVLGGPSDSLEHHSVHFPLEGKGARAPRAGRKGKASKSFEKARPKSGTKTPLRKSESSHHGGYTSQVFAWIAKQKDAYLCEQDDLF